MTSGIIYWDLSFINTSARRCTGMRIRSYSDQEPIRDEVFKCLDNRPSVLKAREIGERIITKMKEFVEIFIKGVAA